MNTKKRPIWAWIISIFYLLSAGYTLLSFFLIFSGIISVNEAQQVYFASLGIIDWLSTLLIAVFGLAAAISLFLMRRVSVILFSIALGLNIVFTIIQALRTNWAEALGGPGLIGTLIGWVIIVVIILYARNLAKKGILS